MNWYSQMQNSNLIVVLIYKDTVFLVEVLLLCVFTFFRYNCISLQWHLIFYIRYSYILWKCKYHVLFRLLSLTKLKNLFKFNNISANWTSYNKSKKYKPIQLLAGFFFIPNGVGLDFGTQLWTRDGIVCYIFSFCLPQSFPYLSAIQDF